MDFTINGFYGILTNPLVGYEQLAKIMVNEGVKIIQLRMKDTPREVVLAMAERLRVIIPKGVSFIINDDAFVAQKVGADGVHLGQGDMSYSAARQLLGAGAIIGLSTHNPNQTRSACAQKPNYIGVGPVYATPTKKIPDPPLGLSGMQEMLKEATVPAVVLGGIDHGNLKAVVEAGAQNVCAVRCINASETPAKEIRKMLSVLAGK